MGCSTPVPEYHGNFTSISAKLGDPAILHVRGPSYPTHADRGPQSLKASFSRPTRANEVGRHRTHSQH
jgi:hypothetical protein